MPGLKLTTKHDTNACLKAAWRTAQDLGYSLTPIVDGCKRFTATKGSALVSIIAGPFAPHCHFEFTIEAYGSGNELVLERNKPWLTTGAVGVAKVNRQAEELMAAIASAIEKEGGTILERKEF